MPKFEVVSDELRTPLPGALGRGRLSEATQALIDGKTIMLPKGQKAGHFSTTLKARGFRVRQAQRPEGLVLWAEKIEAPDVDA